MEKRILFHRWNQYRAKFEFFLYDLQRLANSMLLTLKNIHSPPQLREGGKETFEEISEFFIYVSTQVLWLEL